MPLQLYGFWRSNAAFRVRVALSLKGLAFEEIDIDLLSGEQFTSAYGDVNPGHAVPTLVHDGRCLTQSLAIIDYLDALAPEPRLIPADLHDRADALSLALVLAADAHPLTVPRVRRYLGAVLGADTAAIEDWCRHWTTKGLETYEQRLMRRPSSPFALGAAPTIADIAIAGQIALADVYGMGLAPYPLVARLGSACFALPAFLEAHPFRQPGYPGTETNTETGTAAAPRAL